MSNKIAGCLIVVAIYTGWAQNGQSTHPSLQQVRQLYESLKFEQAIQAGRALLHQNVLSRPAELIELHRLMALSFFTLGELDSARSHFYALLSLNPDFELDPVHVSPKIIQYFQQLKLDWQPAESPTRAPPGTIRYIILPDPRLAAAWRSALIPGWGQLYKGQKNKALLLGSLFATSAIGTLVSWTLESQSHQDYLEATTPDAIEKNYQDYNRWYKRRRWLSMLTALIWATGVIDALASPAKLHPSLHVNRTQAQLRLEWPIP